MKALSFKYFSKSVCPISKCFSYERSGDLITKQNSSCFCAFTSGGQTFHSHFSRTIFELPNLIKNLVEFPKSLKITIYIICQGGFDLNLVDLNHNF